MKTELKIEFESPYDYDLQVILCSQELLSALSEIGQYLRSLEKYSDDSMSEETRKAVEDIRSKYYDITNDHIPSLLEYL